jgi:rhamnosyl/mannosyltransferase
MKRPRVLHIGKFYPPYKGGMETHLQELCRGLAQRVDLEVIVSNNSRETFVENDGPIRIQRIGNLMNLASAPICPGMSAAIRSTPADIVHLHAPNPTAVLAYFASSHAGRLVVTHHSDIVRQRFLKLALKPLLRRLMARADALICFSPNYAETSLLLKQHRDKCHVIPHGIDPNVFENVDENEVQAIRNKYGKHIVLAVGRLVYYKGIEYLIRAMSDVDAALIIIGTGPLHDQLRNTARKCGVLDRVHLVGQVENVVPFYHAARVFVLPSVARSEAFGIVQLEAMACGTPVINTHLDSGVPYVSLHDASGLTVPPADVASLRGAINRVMGDEILYQRLSRGARNRVGELFTATGMADRTFKIYEAVLEDEPGLPAMTFEDKEPVLVGAVSTPVSSYRVP